MYMWRLDGFSLAKLCSFAKLSPCQTFPLYGIACCWQNDTNRRPRKIDCYVLVIPQYEYDILVITQVQGKAEDAGDK